MSAAGQTATRAWIDLPQWPAREISPHKHARPDGRYDPFRLRGNWRFDRVGAVGGCAAISATQDVMARNSADVRFGSKADIEARPRNVRFTPEKQTSFSTAECRFVPGRDIPASGSCCRITHDQAVRRVALAPLTA
jgi:hypothetical protein